MTKSDAASILGLNDDASLADVRRRYQSLHTDYRIRLTNAPTPALKKTYQLKLQEVAEACEALHPGFMTEVTRDDLPSAEPIIADASEHATSPSPRSYAGTRGSSGSTTAPGLPTSTIVASILAVVLASALSLLA